MAQPFLRSPALACLLLAAAFGVPLSARAQTSPAADATGGLSSSAEYIAAFVRYVHWEDEDRIVAWRICVVGSALSAQDGAYAGHEVRGKPFEVRHIGSSAAVDGCHVIDLTAVDVTTAARVLAHAHLQPILAVGNGSAFCSNGGQICLHSPDNKQKFEVNLSAMRDARLGVSARLLSIGLDRTAQVRDAQ